MAKKYLDMSKYNMGTIKDMGSKGVRHGEMYFLANDKDEYSDKELESLEVAETNIAAYGEVTGHHHMLAVLEDVDGETMLREAEVGVDILFRDVADVTILDRFEELDLEKVSEARLLEIFGENVVVIHQEHDACRIDPGQYVVYPQLEFDPWAQIMRRVRD